MSYHPACFRVGPPFSSRRRRQDGLSFPTIHHWGTFVCESCTVRAITRRELTRLEDSSLLALERMRLLDTVHSWARNTHSSYQGKLKILQAFASRYSLPLLPSVSLRHPRCSTDIVLMWCQEAYSLSPGTSRLGEGNTTAFGTIRQLRAALSHLLAWNQLHQDPPGILDKQRRLLHVDCRVTDALPSQLHSQGMAIRLGTESLPSKALLDRHVRSLLRDLEAAYADTSQDTAQNDICLWAVATLLLWLGWLRSSEVFQLRWCDVTVVPPHDGPRVDLPLGIGMVGVRLLPETKSQRTRTVDVILAYETVSGYTLGRWIERLITVSHLGPHWSTRLNPVFLTARGSAWSSHFYRQTFLYPSLLRQQAQGDPALRNLGSIPHAFWSLHSFRNGARSQVSRRRLTGSIYTRRATTMEVYEHGRWRRRRTGEAIDLVYNQWPYYDRIQLTLCCM